MTEIKKPSIWETLRKSYPGSIDDLAVPLTLEPTEEIVLQTDHGEELIKENLVSPRGTTPTKTVDKFFKEFGK